MANAWFLVALGGALGAISRYGVSRMVLVVFDKPVFWATLLVNVAGCFAMGLVYTWLQSRPELSETIKPLLMVGFLGALTTWSTFSMETVLMIQQNQWFEALAYALMTCLFCFVAFYLGLRI